MSQSTLVVLSNLVHQNPSLGFDQACEMENEMRQVGNNTDADRCLELAELATQLV